MKLRQVELESKTTHLITWIEDDARIKPGVHLTLKGDDTEWRVVAFYDSSVVLSEINRTWRVGGL